MNDYLTIKKTSLCELSVCKEAISGHLTETEQAKTKIKPQVFTSLQKPFINIDNVLFKLLLRANHRTTFFPRITY